MKTDKFTQLEKLLNTYDKENAVSNDLFDRNKNSEFYEELTNLLDHQFMMQLAKSKDYKIHMLDVFLGDFYDIDEIGFSLCESDEVRDYASDLFRENFSEDMADIEYNIDKDNPAYRYADNLLDKNPAFLFLSTKNDPDTKILLPVMETKDGYKSLTEYTKALEQVKITFYINQRHPRNTETLECTLGDFSLCKFYNGINTDYEQMKIAHDICYEALYDSILSEAVREL